MSPCECSLDASRHVRRLTGKSYGLSPFIPVWLGAGKADVVGWQLVIMSKSDEIHSGSENFCWPTVTQDRLRQSDRESKAVMALIKTISIIGGSYLVICFCLVIDLIYWRDARKSGVVFGGTLALLLALATFSFVSVFAYFGLAVLTVSGFFTVVNHF